MHLQGELADAHAQGENDESPLQARADADGDMLHASGRDHTWVQILLDADGQTRETSNFISRIDEAVLLIIKD